MRFPDNPLFWAQLGRVVRTYRLLSATKRQSSVAAGRPVTAPLQSLNVGESMDERLCFQDDVDACHELNRSSMIRRPAL